MTEPDFLYPKHDLFPDPNQVPFVPKPNQVKAQHCHDVKFNLKKCKVPTNL